MSLITILILFGAAFFVFTKLYRIALTWFVRSRIDHRWEKRARVMTAVASLPLSLVNALFLLNALFFITQVAIQSDIAVANLTRYLIAMSKQKNWLLLLLTLLFLARAVPQTIAGSKTFAYTIEFKAGLKNIQKGEEAL